jgi:large subunit ribosomal protein L1
MKKTNENKTDTTKLYTLDEALTLLPSLSTSKFVGSVDIDIVLNLKESQKKEIVRGTADLPHSFGEEKKVIVFCEESNASKALKAGATKAGLDDLMNELQGGFNDFDVVLATGNVMAKIVKIGKILGPRGLMPNPKNGTVVDMENIEAAVSSFKAGKISFKSTPEQGTIRMRVAKVDMSADQIKSNVLAITKAIINEARKLNANPIKKVTIKPTMGAGLKVDASDIIKQL